MRIENGPVQVVARALALAAAVSGQGCIGPSDVSEDVIVEQPVTGALTGNRVRTASRLAVIMAHWGNPPTITPTDLRSMIFTGPESTSAWFRENSYGAFELTGDVYGFLQVPPIVNCDYQTFGANVRQAALSAGIPLGMYGQIAYWFPYTDQCKWSGQSVIGYPDRPAQNVWYHGATECSVLPHELMHNYGAQHSRSYDCGDVPIGPAGTCTQSGTGDYYDPMGRGCYHTNAYQKAAQGWFGGCNVVTVTADDYFQIAPLELPSDGAQAIRIPMSGSLCPAGLSNCYYFIEYRQPLGIFGNEDASGEPTRGVLIHVAGHVDFTGHGVPTSPYLLDMTPNSRAGLDDHRDAALKLGKTFRDGRGIRITLDSLTREAATVTIGFPFGGQGRPTCINGGVLPGY